jgi:diguanylate cyclase (GGDEF)-like protein
MKLRHRASIAIAAALIVLIGGSMASYAIARSMASSNGHMSQEQFKTSAQEISLTLRRALQHEQDLAVNASAFVLEHPNATQTEFQQWANETSVLNRYPELLQIGEIQYVPASQLSTFEKSVTGGSSILAGATSTYPVIPSGSRAFYCLQSAAVARGSFSQAIPLGHDFCASKEASYIEASRDFGVSGVIPIKVGGKTILVIGAPVYSGGGVPANPADRLSQFVGWTASMVQPKTVLDAALRDHPGTQIKFRYNGDSQAVFTAGTAPAGSQTVTQDLGAGWSAQLSAPVTQGAVIDDRSAVAVFLAGLIASFLLALLVLIFGLGRTIAMRLVQQRTEEIHHQSLHDALTGLPNRVLVIDRLKQMLSEAQRDGTKVGLLYIDLDNFKDVNDNLGHSAGDEILYEVGARLISVVGEAGLVGRMAGDEFIAIIGGSSDESLTEEVADKIFQQITKPFRISTSVLPVRLSASIGAAWGAAIPSDELLQNADLALHEAKTLGKKGIVAFSPSMQEASQERHDLERDLLAAIDSDQFFLNYQPIVSLENGSLLGVESLLRWNRPGYEMIGPDYFVPVLEISGLIVPVGRRVLEMACRQGALWQDQGHIFSVSVNISARHLEGDQIVFDVKRALEESGFDPGSLTLEITETTLMSDVNVVEDRLKRLKALGVRLAIDDFGTGYSSLSYLRHLSVDELKIDQSFIAVIGENSQSAAIVHTMVELGTVLGLQMVAEGIETKEQLSKVSAENVLGGQGHYFSRPLDAEAVVAFIETATASAQVAVVRG